MKIQYLGTSASEGIPAIFCECETCLKSRKAGGRNIRTRSQAIVDDRLLIDFPADTYLHFLKYNLQLTKIKNCLITHSHLDHLYPAELSMRKDCFSYVEDNLPLNLYSDEAPYMAINDVKTFYQLADNEISVNLIKLYEPFIVEGFEVTALRASHASKSTPVVYLIEKDGKTIFYSNDTSEYPEESMDYLRTLKKPINLISLDCTGACDDETSGGHLNLNRCVALRETLIDIGAADKNTVFVLNHFSHKGKNVLYDDFVKIAADNNFEVSYDGMILEV